MGPQLERHNHDVIVVTTAAAALQEQGGAQFVLLGLELPDLDGLEVCRQLRALSDVPIIGLTKTNTELDRVLALQAGADDCIGRQCSFRELLNRIDAVRRRALRANQPSGGPPSIVLDGLEIDLGVRIVKLDGKPVNLTRKEFELLACLARSPGVVVTREKLMAEVWKDAYWPALGAKATRTIDTHVSSLRMKLRSRSLILTIRGVGFRLGER